jgi:glycosyltransferase involved in cell wall biosynthesis
LPSEQSKLPFAPTADRPRFPKVSVVVPTYNEAKNLPHVFSLLPEDLHEVIVVDGRSVDDTIAVAQALRPDVRIVRQNRRGKGNALACGFAAVTGDVIVMLDADGSADPREIPLFVAALTRGADFAKGTRFAAGGGSSDITPTRAWGNRWLNRAVNVMFGTTYTDLCYGYNAFWSYCLPVLALDAQDVGRDGKLWGDGFEIETIINTRVAKARLSIVEVPSFEFERIHGESNLNTWRDGFRVLRALVVERLNGQGTRHRVVLGDGAQVRQLNAGRRGAATGAPAGFGRPRAAAGEQEGVA